MDSIGKELNRMYELNKKLLVVFRNIGFDILHFADEYNYPIPSNLRNYFDEAEKLIIELNHPTTLNKYCSLCGKLNPSNADYCCYCGSSLIITRMRHKDGVTRNGDRTTKRKLYIEVLIYRSCLVSIFYKEARENYDGRTTAYNSIKRRNKKRKRQRSTIKQHNGSKSNI